MASGTSFSSAMHVAGFALAHAVWSVSDGETLIPMALSEKGEKRTLTRFASDTFEDGVQAGKVFLDKNPEDVERAAFVYDGYTTLEGVRRDTLIVEVLEFSPRFEGQILLPYVPGKLGEGFAVFRPKFLIDEEVGVDTGAAAQAMFEGLEAHAEGVKVFDQAMQDSAD